MSFFSLAGAARGSKGSTMVFLGKATWVTVPEWFGILVSAKVGFAVDNLQKLQSQGRVSIIN